jgi:peptidoglycan/xylan/chitin deacetylase (PgdA/CDA1 family)
MPELVEHRHGIEAPLVALTFDDGPSPWTEPILEHLERHDAQATFFAIGEAIDARGADILRRIVAGGGEVGNHTFTHPRLTGLSDADVLDEMTRTTPLIEAASGVAPIYWRAPYLDRNDHLLELIGTLGLREIELSVVTADYAQSADATAEDVLGRIQAGDIVALHDGRNRRDGPSDSLPTRENTVAAVATILDGLTMRGLRCVTVTELLAAT